MSFTVEQILEYLQERLQESEVIVESSADIEDYEYYTGVRDAYDHLFAKFSGR